MGLRMHGCEQPARRVRLFQWWADRQWSPCAISASPLQNGDTHARPLSLADSQAVLLWCLFDRKLYYHTMNTALATSALLPVPLPCYYFLFRARQCKNLFHLDSYTTIISSQISHSSYFLISPSTQHQSVWQSASKLPGVFFCLLEKKIQGEKNQQQCHDFPGKEEKAEVESSAAAIWE